MASGWLLSLLLRPFFPLLLPFVSSLAIIILIPGSTDAVCKMYVVGHRERRTNRVVHNASRRPAGGPCAATMHRGCRAPVPVCPCACVLVPVCLCLSLSLSLSLSLCLCAWGCDRDRVSSNRVCSRRHLALAFLEDSGVCWLAGGLAGWSSAGSWWIPRRCPGGPLWVIGQPSARVPCKPHKGPTVKYFK